MNSISPKIQIFFVPFLLVFIFTYFFLSKSIESESIRDSHASLYWQKCTLGLEGDLCTEGSAKEITWNEAQSKCSEMKEEGLNWRIPTLEELQKLVTEEKQTPRIDRFLFPGTIPKNYWSAEDSSGRITFINFYSGDKGSYSSSGKKGYVRCVADSFQEIKTSGKEFVNTIQNRLPPNWFLSLEKGKLTIERGQKVWKYMENKSNSLEPPDEKKIKKIMKNGEQLVCRLVFVMEEKWPSNKWKSIKDKNAKIQKEIKNLPVKHKIAKLKNSETEEYTSNLADERMRISTYKEEKRKLEAGLHPVPDYEWDGMYFFLIEKNGLEEDYFAIYPQSAVDETKQVLEIFKDKTFRYIE